MLKLKEEYDEYLFTYRPDSTVSNFCHICFISLATHPSISLYFFAEPPKSKVADMLTLQALNILACISYMITIILPLLHLEKLMPVP